MIVADDNLEANRRDAAQPTGPVAAEGDSRSVTRLNNSNRSSRNACFAAFREHWRESLLPVGILEETAFEIYVSALWRKWQVINAVAALADTSTGPSPFLDDSLHPRLEWLIRYEGQLERRIIRAHTELERQQRARQHPRRRA